MTIIADPINNQLLDEMRIGARSPFELAGAPGGEGLRVSVDDVVVRLEQMEEDGLVRGLGSRNSIPGRAAHRSWFGPTEGTAGPGHALRSLGSDELEAEHHGWPRGLASTAWGRLVASLAEDDPAAPALTRARVSAAATGSRGACHCGGATRRKQS